jgi:glycosyltransferase involved in cell wall biosynthesis
VIKGYDIFAKALNKLFKEFDIEVKIAGDGDKKIKNDFLNILEYDVELLGDISDIERFYNDIDILISASYMEGFSNSIAEAMACEVACVVTDVGDSKVIVGDTGIVVKPNEEELYKGIKTMLNLDYKSLGKKARQRVIENFSIEKMINNTQKEILKCVE